MLLVSCCQGLKFAVDIGKIIIKDDKFYTVNEQGVEKHINHCPFCKYKLSEIKSCEMVNGYSFDQQVYSE